MAQSSLLLIAQIISSITPVLRWHFERWPPTEKRKTRSRVISCEHDGNTMMLVVVGPLAPVVEVETNLLASVAEKLFESSIEEAEKAEHGNDPPLN